MSIIALGVSLYVHYIAFSKVAANSRAPQAPHYKLATTRSLQIPTSVSLRIRYDPVTTSSLHGRFTYALVVTRHYKLATTWANFDQGENTRAHFPHNLT